LITIIQIRRGLSNPIKEEFSLRRVILIVLDSVGIGELPDASKYGDEGSNTLNNIAKRINDFSLPNLQKMGLGNIEGIPNILNETQPLGASARMAEKSAGKDTTIGHWEISGLIMEKPFPVYPNGFPLEIIKGFEKAIGAGILGNKVASGTEIIKELGKEHVDTGKPIVYTSADSVFQIAAHEGVIPIERQYEICRIAREILVNEHAVARVIARPFEGSEGNFSRTDRRRDFSLSPVKKTVLDYIVENGMQVKAVGKIEDIFNKKGITDAVHTHNNMDGVDKTLLYMKESFDGLIFTNLVDFDMLYGHRNNVEGYASALIEFDTRLPELTNNMNSEDILIITADHGCDPTTQSTDHSREYTPMLIYGEKVRNGVKLGTRESFSDIGATIAEYLGIVARIDGQSFWKEVYKEERK